MKIALTITNKDLVVTRTIDDLELDIATNGLSGNVFIEGKKLYIEIEDLKKLDTVLYFLNKVTKRALKLNK